MQVSVETDDLVIKISKHELRRYLEYSEGSVFVSKEDAEHFEDGTTVITDFDVFLTEIVSEIKREREDGSSKLHTFLLMQAAEAVESGASGVEIIGE